MFLNSSSKLCLSDKVSLQYSSDSNKLDILMYLNFLFYNPEDGHMVGRNMCEFIVYIK
jgi:hypothetical protein